MQQLKTLDDLYNITHTLYTADEFVATLTYMIDKQIKQHYSHYQKELELDNNFANPVIDFKLLLIDKDIPVEITYKPYSNEHKLNQSVKIIKYENKTVDISVYRY